LVRSLVPVPDVPPHLRAKLLWVIDNEKSYKSITIPCVRQVASV
jgi:hypothetical protein